MMIPRNQQSSTLTQEHGRAKLWCEVLKRNDLAQQSAEHSSSAIVSFLLNMGLLILIVSGDFSRVYLTEVLLPRWLMLGVLLSEATQYVMRSTDDLDSADEIWKELGTILERRFKDNIKNLFTSTETEDPTFLRFAATSPTWFSYTFFHDELPKDDEDLPGPKDAMDRIADVICPKVIRVTPLKMPFRMWREWQVLRGVKHLSKIANDEMKCLSNIPNAPQTKNASGSSCQSSLFSCCCSNFSQSAPEDEQNDSATDAESAPPEQNDWEKNTKAKQKMWICYLNEVALTSFWTSVCSL